VDGEPIPAAVKGPDGVIRAGAARELGSPARIELAGALIMHFNRTTGT
jgi:hypothetical protein